MFQRIAFFAVAVTFSLSTAVAGGLESTRIENSDGSCVREKPNEVVAASCSASTKQQWMHTEHGQLQSVDALVVDGTQRCIAGTQDGGFTMADCSTSATNQQFIAMDVNGVVEYLNIGTATSLDLQQDTGSASPDFQYDITQQDETF